MDEESVAIRNAIEESGAAIVRLANAFDSFEKAADVKGFDHLVALGQVKTANMAVDGFTTPVDQIGTALRELKIAALLELDRRARDEATEKFETK